MNHMVEKFKCMKGKHNYIWSQTPKKSHLAPPGIAKAHTMSEWQKCTQIGSTPCHSAIRCMRFVIHVRICHVEDSTAKSPVALHLTWHSGSGGCLTAGGIRYHVADGHWPITECWIHGFWATYMLLIFCIFNHSLGSFCS